MEIVIEFIVYVVIDLFLRKVCYPFLKHSAVIFQWLLNLGKTNYRSIYEKDHNTVKGLFIWTGIILTIILMNR